MAILSLILSIIAIGLATTSELTWRHIGRQLADLERRIKALEDARPETINERRRRAGLPPLERLN